MMKFLKGFLITVQFFTVIPLRCELPMDDQHLKRAVQAFPLLGLFQGALYSSFLYMLLYHSPFSHLAAAFLLWLAIILLTGGIHLDGWMDASDAYFSYRDRKKRLEIMKDPRVGAFGVLSILIFLSSRFFFIDELTVHPPLGLYVLIAAIPFLSKSVMGALLVTVNPAKEEGLGYLFQKATTPNSLWMYPLYWIIFLILVCYVHMISIFSLGILFIAAIVCFIFCRYKAVEWFGGITGDVLGASVEETELCLWMTLWLLHYFVMG